MWRYLQTKWHSLVFRLLFYFVLTLLLVALVLAASFTRRFEPHWRNEILPNVERYIEYLIADIGQPPDLRAAQRLANELPFELRIEGQGIDWTSSSRVAPIDGYRFEPAPQPYAGVYLGRQGHQEYLLIERQGYRYLFTGDNSFRRGSERRHWALFLLLGAILFALYLAIRRLFRPIEAISAQVDKIAEGDLEQGVEVRGGGELASLARGINHMSAQIESMLESKSSLLLAISHELRSPLTRMRVNLELLEQGEIQRKLVEDIHEMEALVAAILESEKLGSGHAPLNISRCELANLVGDLVEAHPCRDRIDLHLVPVEIDVDPLRIGLMLKNLVDNACRYSRDEGARIDINLRSDSGYAIIEVIDRGIGIEADQIAHLTEAFYRPDSARRRDTGGYGLGLYLCKLIVDAHRGQIAIESEPDRGTRVTVKLPVDNS